jgi:hypothetical protein
VENTWNWIADHITEGFSGGSNIAAKGGALVESTKGTWLNGLGSEHWWLYQLNLKSASNVAVTLLQSETNYDQGDNTKQVPPAPWTADVQGWGDPDFSWCDSTARCHMGLANFINGGSDIYYYGSASWAFFSGPGYQGCAGSYECQGTFITFDKKRGSKLQFTNMRQTTCTLSRRLLRTSRCTECAPRTPPLLSAWATVPRLMPSLTLLEAGALVRTLAATPLRYWE